MSKSRLRKQMLEIVKNVRIDEKQSQSRAIFQRIIEHPRYKQSSRLSIYLSTPNEVDTIHILRHALEVDKKQCFIPLVKKSRVQDESCGTGTKSTRMIMVELTSMKEYEELPLNNYGIKEPVEPVKLESIACPRVNNSLELVIVPGVAFSKDGRRLGHGRGYYDEFLTSWNDQASRALYTIGLAFREQIVDNPLAVEGQDYVLNEVISC